MNEEITIAIDELRLYPTDHAWFLPVLLDDNDVPDRDIGAGETLRSLWTKLYGDWDAGVARLLQTIRPQSARLFELGVTLHSDSARARIAALDVLAELGPNAAEVTPTLLEQLKHSNVTVRRAAVAAVARVITPNTPESVLALLTLIADNRERVTEPYAWSAAARTLGQFGAPAVGTCLIVL